MAVHRRHIAHRDPQSGTILPPTSVAGTISAPAFATSTSFSLTFANTVPLTTFVQTVLETGSNGSPTTVVTSQTVFDTAEYASITSSLASVSSASAAAASSKSAVEVSSTQRSTATNTASNTKSTSTAAASSSSKTNVLIPAVVVPIVVLLIASFVAFWFFMRRRHQRDLKNTNFVMTGKGEKLQSKSPSQRSNPSSIDTTTPLKQESGFQFTDFSTKETSKSPPPSYPHGDIGIARALTPQDQSRPPRTDSAGAGRDRQQRNPYKGPPRNFNSPRPGTAGNPSNRPPNPSFQGQGQGRNRSHSQPGDRGNSPPSAYRSPPMNTYVMGSPDTSEGRSQPQSRSNGLPRSPSNGPRPNPRSAGGLSPNANNITRMGSPNSNRAPPPAPLNTVPLGAYNGEGPISQFSPIVKETPNKPRELRSSRLNDDSKSRPFVAASPLDSPASSVGHGLGLSEENMRIARLGAGISAGSANSPVGKGNGNSNSNSNSRSHNGPAEHPLPSPVSHRRGASREGSPEDEFDDARSEVSSLHEMERFDFDNWAGDGRRVSEEAENRGRISPVQRDSFSLDVR